MRLHLFGVICFLIPLLGALLHQFFYVVVHGSVPLFDVSIASGQTGLESNLLCLHDNQMKEGRKSSAVSLNTKPISASNRCKILLTSAGMVQLNRVRSAHGRPCLATNQHNPAGSVPRRQAADCVPLQPSAAFGTPHSRRGRVATSAIALRDQRACAH